MVGRIRRAVVFTDIVDSTAVRARIGDEAADDLRREHDHIVGAAVEAADGHVVKGLGDGLMAALPDLDAALTAVTRAMTALAARNSTAAEPIDVTVGIDVGEVAEEGGDLFGMTVVRAARLCGVAAPGQVVVTWSSAEGRTYPTLLARGSVRLKGVPEPVAVATVAWGPTAVLDLPVGIELRNGAGALVSSVDGHVPAVTTPILGRDSELKELRGLLAEHRLVSLIGPGGTGKTRLSIALATAMQGELAHGAWFVDLSGVTEDEAVSAQVCTVLGLTDEGDVNQLQKLIASAADRELLLVLDNCEQVRVGVAAVCRRMLALCPRVRLVVTSRIALGVPGEHVWHCPTLSTDAAVDLLIAAAQEAGVHVEAEGEQLREVVGLVDGLPLAIELAAPRLRTLPLARLEARLREHPSKVGQARSGGRPDRQRSLEALVTWSVDLLEDDQRRLFARLGVFHGTFDLAALTDVCAFDPLDEWDVEDLIADLVDHSLVQVVPESNGGVFRMLRPIREHAMELQSPEEAAALEDRRAEWLEGLFASTLDRLHGPQQAESLARLESFRDDLRVGLEATGDPDEDARRAALLVAAGPYFLAARHLNEARAHVLALRGAAHGDVLVALLVLLSRIEADLDRPDLAVQAARAAQEAWSDDTPDALRAETLAALGNPRSGLTGPEVRRTVLTQAVEMFEDLGERRGLARTLGSLQWVLDDLGDVDQALEVARRGARIAEEVGDAALHALLLDGAAHSLMTVGSAPLALETAMRGVSLAEGLGQAVLTGRLLGTAAAALSQVGDAEAAAETAARALRIAQQAGSVWLEGNARCYLAEAHIAAGRAEDALVVILERPVRVDGDIDARKELMAALLTADAAVAAERLPLAARMLELATTLVTSVPVLRPAVVAAGSRLASAEGDHELAVRLAVVAAMQRSQEGREVQLGAPLLGAAAAALGQPRVDELLAEGTTVGLDRALDDLRGLLERLMVA